MTERLEKAVNTAFEENTRDLMWGTAGLQIAVNKEDIIDKIKQSIEFKFQEAFDDFLLSVEKKWFGVLQQDVADFYRRTSIMIIALENNPMSQAFVRSSSAAQDKGLNIRGHIRDAISKKYHDVEISGTKFVSGFMTVFLRKQVSKIIRKQLLKSTVMRKAAGTAVGKMAGMAVPLVGWGLIAWSAYDIASMAWNVPDDVRKMLQERNYALYIQGRFRKFTGTLWSLM